MNRRSFLKHSMAATASFPLSFSSPFVSGMVQAPGEPKVAILLVDTDRVTTPIDQRIYGQFLEHINHSVEDGLFAEQNGCYVSRARTLWRVRGGRCSWLDQIECGSIPG